MSAYLIKTDDTYSNLTSVFVDGSSAWVLNKYGTVRQFSVDGSLNKTINLELTDSRCIFSDGTYLWVTERGLEGSFYGYVVQYEITSAATRIFHYNKFPTSIVSDGNYAWFTSRVQDTVTKIDALSGDFINDVSGNFSGPSCITFDKQNIYVSNSYNQYVSNSYNLYATVVSKTNDASFSEIFLDHISNCITKDASNVYVGLNNINQISKITLSDLSINSISLDNAYSSYSLASFNNSNLFAYSNHGGNASIRINQINPLIILELLFQQI